MPERRQSGAGRRLPSVRMSVPVYSCSFTVTQRRRAPRCPREPGRRARWRRRPRPRRTAFRRALIGYRHGVGVHVEAACPEFLACPRIEGAKPSICVTGEWRVPMKSRPYMGHSPAAGGAASWAERAVNARAAPGTWPMRNCLTLGPRHVYPEMPCAAVYRSDTLCGFAIIPEALR
jgi:hypothetical protein